MSQPPRFAGPTARALREERGIPQAELARRVGITRGHLRNLESGVRQPSLRVAFAIADRLGVSVEDIAADGDLVAVT